MTIDKGFLLCANTGSERQPVNGFADKFVYDDLVLYIDQIRSRNMVFHQSPDGFIIYMGDRHFHSTVDMTVSPSDLWSMHDRTGLLISYDHKQQSINLQSDFLGTEIVYYRDTKQGLWISDKIENFSRYTDVERDWSGIYTQLVGAYTVGDKTLLKGVCQTRPLQRITYDVRTANLKTSTASEWHSDPDADVTASLVAIDRQLQQVLQRSPDSLLMLSAGWDSRLLLSSNAQRIKATYTHGHLKSREVRIAYRLGARYQRPMTFNPLESTPFGAQTAISMCGELGYAFFPHWYYAANYLAQHHVSPLSAGLFVEHLSGHYGINSLVGGRDKLKALYTSMVRPQVYDSIDATDAISLLTPLLAKGFVRPPWCWEQDLPFSSLQQQFQDDVQQCLAYYQNTGTHGVQELSERFKMEHAHRQFFVLQTKAAATTLGYHHPYADAQLAGAVLKLKYRHRVNYKVSQYIVARRAPELLNLPMAATLTPAKRPIVMQELSRLMRVAGEKGYGRMTGNLPKGLGWNNFQFLNKGNVFQEYTDMLTDEMWDKPAMHAYIEQYARKGGDAYSMLDMLTKIITIDYKLNPTAHVGVS